ncbi:MAG: PQQ-binding-like beta-propeller repeat protein [Myxococcota bacterium]
MIWLAALGVLLASAADVRLIDPAPADPVEARYPGSFDGPPVLHWTTDLPGRRVNAPSHAERARPVLVGDEIYVGAAGGDALYVLSRRNGTLIRSYPASGAVDAEPVVLDDRVYFTDTAGVTWAYLLDGTLLWKREGEAPRPTKPAVRDNLVLVRDVDDLVVALDSKSGELVWRYRRKKDPSRQSELTLYAAPEVAIADDRVLVGFSDGALVALNLVSGDLLWDLAVGEGRYPDMVAPAMMSGSTAFASGYLSPLIAFDPKTSAVRWRAEIGAAAQPVMLTQESGVLLLHPGTDGVLRAIDPTAGDVQWTWDSGRGASLVSPVITPGGILIAGTGGSLALLDPKTGQGTWAWHGDYVLNGLSASPSIDGRQMVFTTNAGRITSMLVPQQTLPTPASRRPESKFKLANPTKDSWGRDR